MTVPSEECGCDKWSTQAKEREKRYDWFGAANVYQKSVRSHLSSKNLLRAGEAQERAGLCFLRAAFQAEALKNFHKRIKAATDAYERGVEIFGRMGDCQMEGKISSCRAKGTYAKLWIERKVSAKRRLLKRCCELAKEALDAYKRMGDQQGFVGVCNDLVVYLDEQLRMASEKGVVQKLLEEADSCCARAIEASSSLGNEYEIARAYYNLGHHFLVSVFIHPLGEKTEKDRQKALGYLRRAIELFEKMNDAYLSVRASLDFGIVAYCRITMGSELGMEYLEQLSKQAANIGDNYTAAWAFGELAFFSWWMIRLEQDPEKKKQWYHKCVGYAEKAIHHSSSVSDYYGIAFACFWHAYAKHVFVEQLETQPDRRCLLLEESINISRKGVEHAERSGVVEACAFAKHALCLSLLFFSEVETNPDKKRKVLEQALENGEESIKAAEAGMAHDLWNRGVYEFFLAVTLLNLAEIEPNTERKRAIHNKASLHRTRGQKLALDYLALYPDRKRYMGLGGLTSVYGDSLNRIFQLTDTKHILRELIEVYTSSASMFSQVGGQSSLVAQAQWQIARTLDRQGRFSEAAGYFDRASHNFGAAAEETPFLKYWHMDNALYMSAWKEIEEAKLCSKTMNHSESTEHYRRASTYLKDTLKWGYLSPYYLALSQVELGEYLRIRNKREEANRTFDEAAEMFEQAEVLLKGRQGIAESSEEKEEILKLSKIAAVKRKSCKGQVAIEEAKVLGTFPEYPERAAGLNAFEDACIRARVTAPKEFAVGRETRIGIDIVNIGRKPGVVVRIEKLVPPGFSVVRELPGYTLEERSLNMKGKLLVPLQAISLSVRVRSVGFSAVEFGPRVVYVNYHGDFVVYDVEPVLMRPTITFESEPVHEVFAYLVRAFEEDHVQRRMAVEKSGWRTRTQILRGAKGMHKSHVYGAYGQLGPVIVRLLDRELIDVEILKGERSRGGRLTKLRIAYEKEAVKRVVTRD